MIDPSRRTFLGGILASLAAPAIVKAEVLMPIRGVILPVYDYRWGIHYDVFKHRISAAVLDFCSPLDPAPFWLREVAGAVRDQLNRTLGPDAARLERAGWWCEFELVPSELGFPAGSLVPQGSCHTQGRCIAVPDIEAGLKVQGLIDERAFRWEVDPCGD